MMIWKHTTFRAAPLSMVAPTMLLVMTGSLSSYRMTIMTVRAFAPATGPVVGISSRINSLRDSLFSSSTSLLQATTTTTVSSVSPFKTLLSVEECLDLYKNSNSNNNNVRFVDGTYYHKGNKNGRDEYEKGPRLPGAVFFDIDEIANKNNNDKDLSHMQPTPELFAQTMDNFGITKQDHVIIYGQDDALFLPRVWFTFGPLMGHVRVSLMQGSLQDWISLNGPIDDDQDLSTTSAATTTVPTETTTKKYQPEYNDKILVKSLAEMKDYVENNDRVTLLDARGSSYAKAHMPGSKQIAYSTLHVPGKPTVLKSKIELQRLLMPHVDNERVVVTCGTGVSACTLFLALSECGFDNDVSVYDGSWQEYGAANDVPKVLLEQ